MAHGEYESVMPLPIEVQCQILHWVETSDLLAPCRLVSRAWNELSCSVLRNRRVHVDGARFYKDQTTVASLFLQPATLPWSSIELSLCSDNQVNSKINDEISTKFGPQIRKLFLVITYPYLKYHNLLIMLSRMPNLVDLNINRITAITTVSQRENDQKLNQTFGPFPPNTEINLSKLKTFTSQYMDKNFSAFVEFLLTRTGIQLAQLDFDLHKMSSNDLKKLLELLPVIQVRHTSLTFMFTPSGENSAPTSDSICKLLAAQRYINIQKLHISSVTGNTEIVAADLRILELALSKIQPLIELHLQGFCDTLRLRSPASKLTLPTLPNLRTLRIYAHFSIGVATTRSNLFFQVNPFTPNDFPALKHVYWIKPSSTMRFNVKFLELFSTSSKQFESVEHFYTCQFVKNNILAKKFPNVVDVIATVGEPVELRSIFKFQKLSALSVILQPKIDVNLFLSKCFRPRPKFPDLEVVIVQCSNDSTEAETTPIPTIADSGAIHFMSLPNLGMLILKNTNISERCVSLLRLRHDEVRCE